MPDLLSEIKDRRRALVATVEFLQDEIKATDAMIAMAEGDQQPEPKPEPDQPDQPNPPLPPAQPKPPASSAYDAVAALKDRVRYVQHASGVMVTQTLVDVGALPALDRGAPLPAGASATATEVILGPKFVGDFRMHIGDRQLTLAPGADVGEVIFAGRSPKGKTAGISIKTGARLRRLAGSVIDGSLGISKAIHQEHTGTRIGSLDEIIDCQFINQQGDGPKLAGSEFGKTRIARCFFGEQELGYGGAHYDQMTLMACVGGMLIEDCYFDNGTDTDTVGVNNWIQFAPYWPGATYGDIDIERCLFVHENDRSFGFMKGSKHIDTATFGQIAFCDGWIRKAGGVDKAFYNKRNFADVWSNMIDLDTGKVIP